ncbi:Uncharacterised protein [Mycobacteroides abscessus subsp. abscessus]|uniref:DUF202 domain-containing protein n=2 Tax=Mycobacteroides abscessus TaxID=36809 RepID=A0AB33T9Q0_9MYCO|nr:DUF202 domain-containing protein [Mycobacteroides abscessus]EIC61958.1 hypothetical protein S7W_24420 [Mycobacteroides abscessus M94]EIU00244.1 hypothetical protein MA4S0726RA_0764 [Mycobacteroides abscessus 4S-0726-RA]EIU00397.1 hypothetical protein MA4S0303_1231 [Mycobacteroides abscessus 4S-0303]EIU01740.1 hypothetical protein MA4S0726RB_0344 [Mycobacteroides abscessus 4S-0726-RB]EIV14361.1 hypothetical protein MA4S0206_0169 [Mycobacteroides abscessus 4S-0206]
MRPHDTYAVERTALAWRRTGLTAAGTAAVLMTHALVHKHTAGAALIAAAVVLGLVAISSARHRSLARGHWAQDGKAIALTTATMVAVILLSAGIYLSNLGT